MNNNIDVFTAQAISGLKQASILAMRTRQKSIRGDDIFFGVLNVLRQHGLFEVFASIMSLPHRELLSGVMEKKYRLDGDTLSYIEERKMPLSNKLTLAIHKVIEDKKIKKLDLGILFYISFQDLSSPCVQHLSSL